MDQHNVQNLYEDSAPSISLSHVQKLACVVVNANVLLNGEVGRIEVTTSPCSNDDLWSHMRPENSHHDHFPSSFSHRTCIREVPIYLVSLCI